MNYRSRNIEILHADVLTYERMGMSDASISKLYGITRMGFCKIRKAMGWDRTEKGERSDRGKPRKTMEEKRANYNRYMREYYARKDKPDKIVHNCDSCKSVITADSFGMHVNGKYLCKNCLENLCVSGR